MFEILSPCCRWTSFTPAGVGVFFGHGCFLLLGVASAENDRKNDAEFAKDWWFERRGCTVEESDAVETRDAIETHAESTLFVELAPGDAALLRLAVAAYAGDTVVTVSRVADHDAITDVMSSHDFIEDAPKRATTRDAVSAVPILVAFARWTRDGRA